MYHNNTLNVLNMELHIFCNIMLQYTNKQLLPTLRAISTASATSTSASTTGASTETQHTINTKLLIDHAASNMIKSKVKPKAGPSRARARASSAHTTRIPRAQHRTARTRRAATPAHTFLGARARLLTSASSLINTTLRIAQNQL